MKSGVLCMFLFSRQQGTLWAPLQQECEDETLLPLPQHSPLHCRDANVPEPNIWILSRRTTATPKIFRKSLFIFKFFFIKNIYKNKNDAYVCQQHFFRGTPKVMFILTTKITKAAKGN